MRILLATTVVVLVYNASAIEPQRLPLSQRTSVMQGAVSEPARRPADHAWKLGLLGLAALSFLIRKRL